MLQSSSKYYHPIREFLDTIPIINTHEHYAGRQGELHDVLSNLLGYYEIDLINTAFREDSSVRESIRNTSLPWGERAETFLRYYAKSKHTAYAKSMLKGLQACWGVEELTLNTLKMLESKLNQRSQLLYREWMQQHHICASIVDIKDPRRFRNIVEKKDTNYEPNSRFAFTLPFFHYINKRENIIQVEEVLGRTITSLDDYMEGFERLMRTAVDFGIVAIKDQSAYGRAIDYSLPPKADAERVFNRVILQPWKLVSSDEAKLLGDWLFHQYMRLAARYDLPVQLHTGHLHGSYDDIRRANAANLINLLGVHRDVRFDLFHANWPFMDEYLYLGKNFPNVCMNLCWVQIIDPYYCVEMMKRAVVTSAHSKVFAFGGDTEAGELTIGYLIAAKNNTAVALATLVDDGWLSLTEAKQIAVDWFYNNPNEVYRLGYERFDVETLS